VRLSWEILISRTARHLTLLAAAPAIALALSACSSSIDSGKLETTAADVLAWDRERGEPPLARELSPEREAELLAAATG
ncbi:MAG: hypothetical protein JWN08_1849, partial [Frankiales bacterium]|nr:hypothetical protein [Frankiales bacterium]